MVSEYSNPAGTALRVGVIGASGWATSSHLPALGGTPGLRVAAVATTREQSARDAADRWGAEHWFTSPAELAHCPDVDLVTISVRAPLHRTVIEQIVDAGTPILCEWPLGTSTQQTTALADRISRAGIPAFVGLQATVNPVLLQIGSLVRSGAIGSLLSVGMRATRESLDPITADKTYTLQAENGAGVVQILGGHSIAALATAVGITAGELAPGTGVTHLLQPRHPAADGRTITATGPDTAATLLPVGDITATLALADSDPDPGSEITIVGTAGRIHARTVAGDVPRLRQPQMADWVADVTTSGGHSQLRQPPTTLPVAARNPALLYRAIGEDLWRGTHTAPTARDAVAVHRVIDSWTAAPQNRATV